MRRLLRNLWRRALPYAIHAIDLAIVQLGRLECRLYRTTLTPTPPVPSPAPKTDLEVGYELLAALPKPKPLPTWADDRKAWLRDPPKGRPVAESTRAEIAAAYETIYAGNKAVIIDPHLKTSRGETPPNP